MKTPKNKFTILIIYIIYCALLLPLAIFSFKHPENNWDMLGYMAMTLHIDQPHNFQEIHTRTYDEAKQHIPTHDYNLLIDSSSGRQKFLNDTAQFKNVLPIYSIKPLYVWACYLFYKSGFDLPKATVMPSIISYCIIGMFLFYWLSKYLNVMWGFIAGFFIMYSNFSVAMSRLSTPDLLSAMLLLMFIYCIIEKPHISLLLILGSLCIFTRLDNIINCFFLISFHKFYGDKKRLNTRDYIIALILFAAAYCIVILLSPKFGWTFNYFDYARHISFSRDFSKPVSISSHLSLMFSEIVTAIVASHITFFMFIAVLILCMPRLSVRSLSYDQSFTLLLIGIIFFRFLFLPDLTDRFYYSFYLTIIVLLVRKIYSIKNIIV